MPNKSAANGRLLQVQKIGATFFVYSFLVYNGLSSFLQSNMTAYLVQSQTFCRFNVQAAFMNHQTIYYLLAILESYNILVLTFLTKEIL